MDFFVATTNPGKLADFRHAASLWQNEAVSIQILPGLQAIPEPIENALTFEGNARLKAEHYSRYAPGIWILCDDSGLEVEALEGRPGVRSARFAKDVGAYDEEAGLDASNNAVLLLAMLEQTDRRARYRCVLALAKDSKVYRTSSGELDGELLSDPEGEGGFGYDPLFFVPEIARTMAQTTPEERLALSHRGRALRSLLQSLSSDPFPDFGQFPR